MVANIEVDKPNFFMRKAQFGYKDRLRFLSTAKNMVGDAARLHEYLSKTRSTQFR